MFKKKTERETFVVAPPNFKFIEATIRGTSLLVQNRFSTKASAKMRETQEAGGAAKVKKPREARNFKADFEEAMYRLPDGGYGIPAASLRNSMIGACSVAGIVMSKTKLAVFVEADGYDVTDQTALVRITEGAPQPRVDTVRNATGVADLRCRAAFDPGWKAKVRVRFDADVIDTASVANLLARAGLQVGIGEGRPSSKRSAGLDWGLFEIIEDEPAETEAA